MTHPMQNAHAMITANLTSQEDTSMAIVQELSHEELKWVALALSAQAAAYLEGLAGAGGVHPLEAMRHLGAEYQTRIDDGRIQ